MEKVFDFIKFVFDVLVGVVVYGVELLLFVFGGEDCWWWLFWVCFVFGAVLVMGVVVLIALIVL